MGLRNAFKLVANKRGNENDLLCQGLRDFVERIIRRNNSESILDPEFLSDSAEATRWVKDAMAPLTSSSEIFTFDIESAVAFKSEWKISFFVTESLRPYFDDSAEPSKCTLDNFALIQDALFCTKCVLLFDRRYIFDFEMLGARGIRTIHFPALPSPHYPKDDRSITIVAHAVGDSLVAEVQSAIASSLPHANIEVFYPHSSANNRAFTHSRVHVHIGFAPMHASRYRVIDSFALRSSVVQLISQNMPSSDDGDVRVHHLRSGFLVSTAKKVVESIARIYSDPAIVAIFQRNGDQVVDAFNQNVEQQILDAIA